MKYLIALMACLSLNSVHAETKKLPPIGAPQELIETSSEFAEGTITRMTAEDIEVFLPWAQNAQKVLTKALTDIETMPIRMQVDHLNTIMKSVIRRSGSKSYQMFMRFALNRSMLLVQELTKEADIRDNGILENALDIQVKSIKLALSVAESDLSFQRRVSEGNDSVKLEYAKFGIMFGKSMLQAINSVFDASAQYRLLYKTLEIVNWDLSRDDAALDYADLIIDIYNSLTTMDENPSHDDLASIFAIRRLNIHVEELSKLSPVDADSSVVTIERGSKEFKIGNNVVVVAADGGAEYATISELRETTVVVKYKKNATFAEVRKSMIAFLSGCERSICTGETVLNKSHDWMDVVVVAIEQSGKFVILYPTGRYAGQMAGTWSYDYLNRKTGCFDNICVGDNVFNLTNQKRAKVVGLSHENKFTLEYADGELKGKRGGEWTRNTLTKDQ